MTWIPMGTTGFSEESGSWKIIASWLPRMSRSLRSLMVSRFWPSNSARPPILAPLRGSSPIRASEVTDLPQPDSPTRPTTWPWSTSKETPSTAVASLRPRAVKVTLSSSTESSDMGLQPRNFGSRASRMDSPSRVKPRAVMMIPTAG